MNYRCLDLARTGDRQALDRLIDELRPRLARMAAYYARNCGEDADDLLQEAWTGLLEALPDLDIRIGNPEQYLLQYARWRLLDALRRARTRRCPVLEQDLVEFLTDGHGEEALSRVDAIAFVRQLPSLQRSILTCLLAGMTWREAGSRLGCTSANIAYHVKRIRSRYETWRIA